MLISIPSILLQVLQLVRKYTLLQEELQATKVEFQEELQAAKAVQMMLSASAHPSGGGRGVEGERPTTRKSADQSGRVTSDSPAQVWQWD